VQQKLAKKEGARIDRNRDIERLWEFYQQYKRRHKVDDIQREEQKWRESGAVSANIGEYVSVTLVSECCFAYFVFVFGVFCSKE